MFTDLLPSNACPTVARVCFRGNVFTESLPSNGYTRHNINSFDHATPVGQGMPWFGDVCCTDTISYIYYSN
jgi:hypothetical protein